MGNELTRPDCDTLTTLVDEEIARIERHLLLKGCSGATAIHLKGTLHYYRSLKIKLEGSDGEE